MATTLFRPASRKKVRGRIGIDGPAGAGKTFTALRLAFSLAKTPKIAVINSESGAVEKYLGLSPDEVEWQFDVCELPDFAPTTYTSAILEAGRLGYEVIVIDSLSHAWNGVGGALEIVSKMGGSSFTAWKDVTPMHNAMIEAILRSPAHVIATLRSKMEYVLEEYEDSNGRKKSAPRKIGMAPVQRNGMEYEFDVFADLDHTHTLTVSKTRCPDLDGAVVVKPGAIFFEPLVRWLNEGTEVDPSYYIATEADLQRSLAARESAARSNGNGHSTPQPPQKSFREIAEENRKTKEGAQATEAAGMEASSSMAGGGGNEAAPPVTAPASDNESAREQVGEIKLTDRCVQSQVAEIRRLLADLVRYVPDIEAKVIAVVKGYGHESGKARDLSVGEAAAIIAKLTNRLSEKLLAERLDIEQKASPVDQDSIHF